MSYVGQTQGGVRHGTGTFTYRNAYFKYEGDWVDGKKHGRGRFYLGDGSYYEGEFHEGEIEGSGVKRWPDGSTYEGQFHAGELHGRGAFTSSTGEHYDGEWKNNKRHGTGTLTYSNGDVYEGSFLLHKPHGNGTISLADGGEFTGEWVEGSRQGTGTMRYPHGGTYQGEWLAGVRHGDGKYQGSEGDISYAGEWVQDEPVGLAKRMVAHVGPWEPPPEPVEAKGKGKGGAKGKKGAAPEAPVDPPGTVVVLAGTPLPTMSIKTLSSDESERARVEAEEAEKAALAKEEEERKAKEAAETAAKGGKGKGKPGAAAAEAKNDDDGENGEEIDPERAGFKVWEDVSVCESGRNVAVQIYLEAAAPDDLAEGGVEATKADDSPIEFLHRQATPPSESKDSENADGPQVDEGVDGREADEGAAAAAAGETGDEEGGDSAAGGGGAGAGAGAGAGDEAPKKSFTDTPCRELAVTTSSGVASFDGLILPETATPGLYVCKFSDRTARLEFGKPLDVVEVRVRVMPPPPAEE